MTRLAGFLALPRPDRSLCVRAAAAVMAVRLCLGVLGYRRCRACLDRLPAPAMTSEGAAAQGEVERIARFVRAAARHLPPGRNCLVEALTLWWFLRRRGIASEIRIGVRKDAGALDAHAWVECGGTILDAPAAAGPFAPLARPTTT